MHCRWWRDHIRQVHMDFHMPEFPAEAIRNFDAVEYVDHLERGKINMVALFAKCHFGNSFYNTRAGHKHAGLPQDFLMEAASECRSRGIRTLAYYSLCTDKRAWDGNPAWRYQDADGKTYGENSFWAMLCMNSPYKDELVMPQLEEIAADYPVDGYWLDIPMAGGPASPCFCPYCKTKWRQRFGIELTKDTPSRVRQRLVLATVEDYLREVRDIIARKNPELVIAMNCVGMPMASRAMKELCEIGTWESQPHPGDYLSHSFAARTARNDIVDVQVMSVRFYSGWGDLTLKPAAQMTTEFAAMIGNGAAAVSGDQVGVDGTLQPPVYEMFNKSFGFVQEREAVLRDAESVRHAVVLLPVPDPELALNAALIDPSTHFWSQHGPWRGAHKMLVESHVQVDLAYSLLADDLDRFPLIILPEPGAYPAEVYAGLRDYVKQGGTLVAVGNSILHDGRCELEDVLGIAFNEPLSFTNCHFVPAPEVKGETDDIPLQVRGQAFKVGLAGARELAVLHFPMAEHQGGRKEFRSRWSPAQFQRSPFPFATLNQFGKGKAAYVAASIFDIYWQTNHHWLRQFVEALLRYVDPTIPTDVAASSLIETNLMRAGGDLLFNLIHYELGHQGGQNAIAAIERVDAVRDVACTVRCPRVDKVVIEPEGKEIPFEFADGVCRFTVPEVEYLAIARLVGAARGGSRRRRRGR